jgi:hypothetical protein
VKWLIPLIFGGSSIFILIQLIIHWHEIKSLSQVWFPLLWMIGTLSMCWYVFLQKNISVDEEFLYIKNYFKEVAIPLSEIKHVTYSRVWRERQVTIHLKSPSVFGSKISFTPHLTYYDAIEPPEVGALRTLVQEHNERRVVSTTSPPNNSFNRSAKNMAFIRKT